MSEWDNVRLIEDKLKLAIKYMNEVIVKKVKKLFC